MNDDYMSEADNEVDGGYFADLEYAYQQKEYRRQEDKENKAKKEENRKKQLLRQNKCIENLKAKLERKNQQLDQLKQQLAEKDKEIEMLNAIKNNAIECADLFKVALSVRQKDLAIQKLEKVKVDLRAKLHLLESGYLRHFVAWRDICDQINKQIKELKGEK